MFLFVQELRSCLLHTMAKKKKAPDKLLNVNLYVASVYDPRLGKSLTS